MKREIREIVFSFVFLLFLIGSINNANFSSSYPTNVSVVVSPAALSLSIISPQNTTYTNATQLVNISSNGASIWYNWNGTNITYTSPVYVIFAGGFNTLYAYANDSSGNISLASVTFAVITPTPGGGGGMPPQPPAINASMKIIVPSIISLKDTGEVDFQVHIKNSGDVTLNNISIGGYVIGDSKLTNIPIILDKTFITSLEKGKQEKIDVTIDITRQDIVLYEIVISAHSGNPVSDTYNKVFVNYIGKNITNIEKTLDLAEEIIKNNTQCLSLESSISDARYQLFVGNLNSAINKAQTALEACKRITEKLEMPAPVEGGLNGYVKAAEVYIRPIVALGVLLALFFVLVKYLMPRLAGRFAISKVLSARARR
jgi:hypothetical protein